MPLRLVNISASGTATGTCVATGTTRSAGMSNVSYPFAARRLAVSCLNGAVRVTHTRPTSGGMLTHVANAAPMAARKSVVSGKKMAVRVDLGGRRLVQQKI